MSPVEDAVVRVVCPFTIRDDAVVDPVVEVAEVRVFTVAVVAVKEVITALRASSAEATERRVVDALVK